MRDDLDIVEAIRSAREAMLSAYGTVPGHMIVGDQTAQALKEQGIATLRKRVFIRELGLRYWHIGTVQIPGGAAVGIYCETDPNLL